MPLLDGVVTWPVGFFEAEDGCVGGFDGVGVAILIYSLHSASAIVVVYFSS